MEPFLERFYVEVADNLGDPGSSKRLTKAKMLRDLHNADMEIFEALLSATGQESMLGFTETTIALKTDRDFYPLPEGFRQYLDLERRRDVTGSPVGILVNKMGSRPHFGLNLGAEILSGSRGMRIRGVVTENADWVLTFLRSPAPLHYARVKSINANSVVPETPGEDAGELHLVPNYYNGSELRIYRADTGAPQTRVIKTFNVTQSGGTFILRDPFDVIPTGEVWYEISPTLPVRYDSIYALDVAMLNLNRREKPEKARFFEGMRRKKWSPAASYIMSNVMDRGPTRNHPLKAEDRMPAAEVPYGFRGGGGLFI